MKRTFFSVSLLSVLLVSTVANAAAPKKATVTLAAVVATAHLAKTYNLLDMVPDMLRDPIEDACKWADLTSEDVLDITRNTTLAMLGAPEGNADADHNTFFNFSEQRALTANIVATTIAARTIAAKMAPATTAKYVPATKDAATTLALTTSAASRFAPQLLNNNDGDAATTGAELATAYLVQGVESAGVLHEKLNRTLESIRLVNFYSTTNNGLGAADAPAFAPDEEV